MLEGLEGPVARCPPVTWNTAWGVRADRPDPSRRLKEETPLGGFKQSGFGREFGLAAVGGYTELKNVFVKTEV
jgi:hypothetical protein